VADTAGSFERDGQTIEVSPAIAVATAVFSVGLGALGILARVVFTLFLRRGFNWARIVVTVLFGTSLLPPYSADPIDLIMIAATVAGLVLIWLSASNAFFRDVKRARTAHKARQLG
jgi:predicted membrane channel-forming protein YqfA (hemolysin III family)